jgi:site-specific DNA recombinase
MAAKLRCAIYTRKSSEEGLEQDFNSLHAQREACEAYVLSQVGEGWSALSAHYDDGGFSGGSMERPGLAALLRDIAAGKIDIVVVYKVDRLTRSLADFAKIVEQFDARGVSFVSVTQAFNTTSSMGRLTLNVLLSFAQFEREVTGERIRDKIAASKAKGMWMGGIPPLGYDFEDRKLVVNQAEAATVRLIFQRYLEVDSAYQLVEELKRDDIRSKAWTTARGKAVGGCLLTRGAVFHILASRVYRGEIVHKHKVYPGQHDAIISAELFEAVASKRKSRAVTRSQRLTKATSGALAGRIFDQTGAPMAPSFSYGRRGKVYRYYVAASIQRGSVRKAAGNEIDRLSAPQTEAFAADLIGRLAGRPISISDLGTIVRRIEVRPTETHFVVDCDAFAPGDHPALVFQAIVSRLPVGDAAVVEPGSTDVRIVLRRRLKLRGGQKSLLGATYPTARVDKALVAALRRVHGTLQRLGASPLTDGQTGGATAVPSKHGRLLARLAFVRPDIQRNILEGALPADFTLKRFMASEVPLAWADQDAWIESFRAVPDPRQ